MKKKVVKRRTAFEELLKARGITAYALAKELGYKASNAVYKWIYGVCEPNAATMLKLTLILDVSVEEILRIFAE